MINTIFDSINTVAFLVTILAVMLSGPIAVYFRRRRGLSSNNESLLLSFYIPGKLYGMMKTQKMGNLRYSFYVAGETNALIYRIELPFVTEMHLVGIPKEESVVQLDPTHGEATMEPVNLEGNYNKYFQLYVDAGKQQEARVALDPKAMVFTIDFCRSHSWEIVNNELYFVQVGANQPDDPTSMFEDISTFIDEIRPAVEHQSNQALNPNLVPYAEERRESLPCPICSQAMPYQSNHFACPDGHGVLISGRYLKDYNSGKPVIPKRNTASNDHGPLKCPSCSHVMQHAPIDGARTPIDSCVHCPYRWLDNAELSAK